MRTDPFRDLDPLSRQVVGTKHDRRSSAMALVVFELTGADERRNLEEDSPDEPLSETAISSVQPQRRLGEV